MLALPRSLGRMFIIEPVGRNKKTPRRPKREFAPEFKAEIVALCQRGDRTIAQVVADFELVDSAVRRWISQAERQADTRRCPGTAGRVRAAHTGRRGPQTGDGFSSRRRPGERASVHRGGERRRPGRHQGLPVAAGRPRRLLRPPRHRCRRRLGPHSRRHGVGAADHRPCTAATRSVTPPRAVGKSPQDRQPATRTPRSRRAIDVIGMYPPMKHRQLDSHTPRPRHTRTEEPVGGKSRVVRCHTTARVGLAVDGRLRRATIDDNVAMFIVVGAIVPPGDRYGSQQPICPIWG